MPRAKVDFQVVNHGSLYLLIPHTPRAKQWVRDNLSPNHTKYDDASVIEHRYIGDIIDGIQADDLEIAMSTARLSS